MIQRIQSLFILAAGVLSVVMIFHPVTAMGFNNGVNVDFGFFGLRSFHEPPVIYTRAYPLAILMSITTAINIVALFSYNRRVLQMRLCVYNILLHLGLAGLMFFYFFHIKNADLFEGAKLFRNHFSYSVILPFINIILLFQAFRAIRRDELLVKSYDRLR